MLPAQTSRYRLDVGGYRMHVQERGTGQPVLLLHGNPTWGFLYRKVMTDLAGEPLRQIVPDLVGLGFSDKPRRIAEHTLDAHARWIRRLIELLGLRDLLFVGHDWGGPIGLRALADLPGRVRALVLLNTVASPPREGFRPTTFHRFSRIPIVSDFVFRGLGFPQNILSRVQGDSSSISGPVARAYRYPLRSWRQRIAPLALARMVPHDPDHPSIAPLKVCRDFVETFRGPVAIVWGDRDPILGRARGWMEKLLPAATVTATQAGHFLQEEVPGQIATAIGNVVRRLEADSS
jgi:haloalkane dehalogenase